jgi:hypothetical protein
VRADGLKVTGRGWADRYWASLTTLGVVVAFSLQLVAGHLAHTGECTWVFAGTPTVVWAVAESVLVAATLAALIGLFVARGRRGRFFGLLCLSLFLAVPFGLTMGLGGGPGCSGPMS